MKHTGGLLMLGVGGLIVVLASLLPSLAAPAEIAQPTVDLSIYGRVVQLGWVVKDLDAVVGYWEMLGLKDVHRAGVLEFQDITYRGKKTPLSFKMAIGRIGDVEIEWVQPVKGKSIFDEFLQKHGEGIHHLAFAMPTPEKLHEQLKYFKSKGASPVQQGTWQGTKGQGHFAFVDLGPQGAGLTLELFCNPDLPPAGATSENEYPLNQIAHYAMVVRDLKKVGTFYERLGFGGTELMHVDLVQPNFRGRPGKFDMTLGWWHWQTLPIEWIQPLVGPSVYDEYVKEHGEGVQHLGFIVKDMDAAIEVLKVKGAPVAQSGGWDAPSGQGRFTYFDTDAHGGVTLEFVWNKPRNR